MITPESLANAEASYREAFRLSEELRAKRNAAIRQALEDAWTHAQISRATGLTRGRIGQLAREATCAECSTRLDLTGWCPTCRQVP